MYEKPADVREHERLTKASGSRPNLAHLAQRRLLDWPQRFLGVLQDLARLEQRESMISTSADRVRRSTRRRKIVLKIVKTHTRAAAGSAAGPSARMPAGKCPESEIARCGPGRPDLFPLPFCPDRRVDRGGPLGYRARHGQITFFARG